MVAIPAPTPEPVPAKPDPARIEAATARLAEIDERISSLTAAIAASKAELATAQSAATPLRDDVDARRRLFESGIIAGNAVKAAEQELATAEAAVTAAQAQVTEAESALGTAESDRDAALSGLEAAKTPIEQPAAAPAVVTVEPVVTSVPVPEPGLSPITAPPPPVPDPEPVDLFPAPSVGPALAELAEPPPMLNPPVRLDRGRDLPDAQRLPVLPLPTGADDLARRRWEDAEAPWQCVVSQALTPRGARVAEGTPVMELRRTSVARLHAVVAEDYVGFCRVGAPIEVAFPSHGVAYRGWISAVEATHAPDAPGARIEVFLARGTAGQSTVYSDIEWIALTTPAIGDTEPLTYEPPVRPTRVGDPSRFFPLGLEQSIPSRQHPPADGQLTGRLELVSSKRPSGFASGDPVAEEKLDRLVDWRESFVEGMRTTVFPETDLTLTYPRTGDSARAVERMATRRVSHRPNLCAGTMRQALGWGLGDAAAWARRLPERGYKLREDGVARPGDILVWPFTYGPSRSQHIGIAVGQGGTVMLLSNEGGVLGTTRLKPHYLAFHKPETLARAGDETPTDG